MKLCTVCGLVTSRACRRHTAVLCRSYNSTKGASTDRGGVAHVATRLPADCGPGDCVRTAGFRELCRSLIGDPLALARGRGRAPEWRGERDPADVRDRTQEGPGLAPGVALSRGADGDAPAQVGTTGEEGVRCRTSRSGAPGSRTGTVRLTSTCPHNSMSSPAPRRARSRPLADWRRATTGSG